MYVHSSASYYTTCASHFPGLGKLNTIKENAWPHLFSSFSRGALPFLVAAHRARASELIKCGSTPFRDERRGTKLNKRFKRTCLVSNYKYAVLTDCRK